MKTWTITPPAAPLGGATSVPGDKSIGHRALLFGALATGETHVRGLSGGEDNARTAAALEALGVRLERIGPGQLVITGVGLRGFAAPTGALECGNSGTTMRLLCGVLAGQPFTARLVGDASLSRRPMARVAEPLGRMGARITGAAGARGELVPPLEVEGGPLAGIEIALPVASAQVKSALILAGLLAGGRTVIDEPGPSRDHTERMLVAMGAPLLTPRPGRVVVEPDGWSGVLSPRSVEVPGDPSSAAFLIAAGVVAGGEVLVRDVCTNPTRTGFLDVLGAMGARVGREGERDDTGEPVADLRAEGGGALAAFSLGGDAVVRAIDEIPILCVLAARARGASRITDAGELRVKESDRLAATAAMLRGFGVEVEELPAGLVVTGTAGAPFRAAVIDSHGDHRIAMSAAVAALCADGTTTIRDVGAVDTSFPHFAATLRHLGAALEEVEAPRGAQPA